MQPSIVQEYFVVHLRHDGIVHLVRTGIAYENLDAISDAYNEFAKVVDTWLDERRAHEGEHPPLAWLYDVRGAPVPRNDPEFEAKHHEVRCIMQVRSPAIAAVTETAAGEQQLRRIARESDNSYFTTWNMEDAITFLHDEMNQGPGQT